MRFIVVLGNSQDRIRKSRVHRAVQYFKTLDNEYDPDARKLTYTSRLVFSGKSPEAELMRDYAIELGILRECCLIENESFNTYENMIKTVEMLAFLGWFKPTIDAGENLFTICTSKFHAKRSLIMALTSNMVNFGKINIITDDDDGDDIRRQNENNYLQGYADFQLINHLV